MRNKHKLMGIIVPAAPVLATAVAIFTPFSAEAAPGSGIEAGVFVDDIDISGCSTDEAKKLINIEVDQLKKERREIVRLLQEDLTAGLDRGRSYMDRIHKWFEIERQSFRKNKVLVDKAAARFSDRGNKEIRELDTELKKTIENHRMLMEEAEALSRMSGEMLEKAKLRSLRPAFDFRETLRQMILQDRPDKMAEVIAPFLLPRRRKTFSIASVDKFFREPVLQEDEGEKKEKYVPDLDFEYEDEKLSRMIGQNFTKLFAELLERIQRWGTVSLPELNAILEVKFGKEIYRNKDYYAFLAHLAKKDFYVMRDAFREPESFLEAYAAEGFSEEKKAEFADLAFTIEYGEESIAFAEGEEGPAEVRMMTFHRCDPPAEKAAGKKAEN